MLLCAAETSSKRNMSQHLLDQLIFICACPANRVHLKLAINQSKLIGDCPIKIILLYIIVVIIFSLCLLSRFYYIMLFNILHHGGTQGVTGSCHELVVGSNSLLVDCGIFQGKDHSDDGFQSANADKLEIDFSIKNIRALVLTHAHIDHVGRLPYLLAAGFKGPIYCSQATAKLLPFILNDALKLGLGASPRILEKFQKIIQKRIKPLPYKKWQTVFDDLKIKLQPAGHILGSAYVECDINNNKHRIVFSGDLGATYAPLLASPRSPYSCHTLILESTYGNRIHAGRSQRRQHLKKVVEHCLEDGGVILIPAFSLGRTQELLYEFEHIIHQYSRWQDMEIIVDSPMANHFIDVYKTLKSDWDKEARAVLIKGRHPLSFEQMTTINDHSTHLSTVKYLKKTNRPSIVIAGSGMCQGGRILNYIKALIREEKTDILFSGYQAHGSTGRLIQQYGPRQGWVELEKKRYLIRAKVHSLTGYSAHADQNNLINFVNRMRHKPKEIRLVHGDDDAKNQLQYQLNLLYPESHVFIP